MIVLYTTEATAHGGRDGHVRSSDGILDLDLRVPVELGGREERGTNPEQLFAAGYAACFEGTLREVARTRKLLLTDIDVTNLIWKQASIQSFMLKQRSDSVPSVSQGRLRLSEQADAADALRYLVEGRPFGRVVLTI